MFGSSINWYSLGQLVAAKRTANWYILWLMELSVSPMPGAAVKVRKRLVGVNSSNVYWMFPVAPTSVPGAACD
jgi:hypothetical protein